MASFKLSRLRLSLRWLRSPWMILLSVAAGIYIGTAQKSWADQLAPLGSLYLSLLKMCVLPILLTAISHSIGRLMQAQNAQQSLRRMAVVFPAALLVVSGVTVAIALVAGPGRDLSTTTLETLGVLVNQSGIDIEVSLSGPISEAPTTDFDAFVTQTVPDNIFSALSEGQTLKVLIFALIFGISLGLIRSPHTSALFDTLESIAMAFNQVIFWLTYLLPVGLCSLLAHQLSQIGLDVLSSMVRFVLVALLIFGVIYGGSTFVIWWRSRMPLAKVLAALKDPTVLALATSSSLACLPAAISGLSERLGFDPKTTNLVAPLSITLCRFGSVVYFAAATVFVAQLYQAPFGPAQLVIIVGGSVLAGMSTSGVTGILTLTMLGLVLDPLKLPIDAVLVLFIAIDPLMDPCRTLTIVHTGMAATALVADPALALQPSSEPAASGCSPSATVSS